MDDTDNLKIFYTIPIPKESYPYLEWYEDRRLQLYLKKFISEQNLPPAVLPVAQRLVAEMQPATEQQANQYLCNCVTALLAQILLSQGRSKWIKFDIFAALELHHSSPMELTDVYVVGLEIISSPAQFLKNFKPQCVDWYGNLCSFSNSKFRRSLVDRLRSISGLEHFKRTNLGLLKRHSPERVKKSLIAAGEKGERLAGMLILHDCLQRAVDAKTFVTNKPQTAHYEKLLALYREETETAEAAGANFLIADAESLKEHLKGMGIALRNYLQPLPDSLDRQVGNDDQNQTTLGHLVADQASLLWPKLLNQDVEDQIMEICQNLAPDKTQLLFQLYGLHLTEKEIGLQTGCDQATINRRKKRLLADTARLWYQQLAPGKELSSKCLEELTDLIVKHLENFYFKRLE